MEFAAGLHCDGSERHRRLLSLRQFVAPSYTRPCHVPCAAGIERHRDFRVDRMARCKDLRSTHAVDRRCVGFGDSDRRSIGARASRLARGLAAVSFERDDPERFASGTGIGAVQFCGI